MLELWQVQRKNNIEYYTTSQIMPKGVYRDNKDCYNFGSDSSNRNKIRIPRKKASNYTWRNFFRLFPSMEKKFDKNHFVTSVTEIEFQDPQILH